MRNILPKESAEIELSEKELKQVSGGAIWNILSVVNPNHTSQNHFRPGPHPHGVLGAF